MFLMDSSILSLPGGLEKRDHLLTALEMGIIFFLRLFSMFGAKAVP
jgi:hypothetical protein